MEFEPEIKWRSPDSLTPYVNNNKQHPTEQIDKVASSIAEFGFDQPIVVDEKDVIIKGHARREAALRLGLDRIPVVVRDDLSEAQKKASRIADNKTAISDFDEEALAAELAILEEMEYDLTLTGFDESELDELLQRESGGHDESGADEDEVPDVEEVEPRCKLGEVWQLGRHRLGCFDSTDIELVRRLLGDRKVDMVWADPLYGVKIVSAEEGFGTTNGSKPFGKVGTIHKGMKAKPIVEANSYAPIIGDDTIETAVKAYKLAVQLFTKAVHVWWGGNYYAHALPPSSCWIVWDKDNGESFFADAELAWTNQKTAVRLFKHMWNGLMKESERGEKRVHPTQKPRSLFVWTASKYGNPGDVVFDPFVGSGISFLGCEELNDDRTVFGIELSPHYVEITMQRFSRLTGQEPVLVDSL